MTNRQIIILLTIFTLASLASASTIDNINLWIQPDGAVWAEEKLTLTTDSFEVGLPYGIKDLTITSERGPLQYILINSSLYHYASFTLKKPITDGETEIVWIKYKAPTLTSRTEGVWFFNFNTQATPQKTIIRANFPVGSQIISLEPTNLLRTPEKYALLLYPQEKNFYFNLTYQYDTLPATTLPETTTTLVENSNEDVFIGKTQFYLLILLLLLILGSIIYIIWKRKTSEQKDDSINYNMGRNGVEELFISKSHTVDTVNQETVVKGNIKQSVINMLDETEQEIFRLIEKSDEEEVTQAYIYKTTGIPKSTLSEKLKQLEKRKIIYREKSGRTNWIKLQEWIYAEK